eukprot:1230693-Amphidinium_carterae.1
MMQTNLERFAVLGSTDPAEREVDFAQRREEETRRLGLPYPRPVVRVGRPSMDVKWQQVLYKALDNNDFPALAALTDADIFREITNQRLNLEMLGAGLKCRRAAQSSHHQGSNRCKTICK